jgi:hypothetical protein
VSASLFAFAIACLMPALTSIGAKCSRSHTVRIPTAIDRRPRPLTGPTTFPRSGVVDGAASSSETARSNGRGKHALSPATGRTDRGVEVLFSDGSTLDIDEFSSVDLLSDSIALASGRFDRHRAHDVRRHTASTAPDDDRIRIGRYRITVMDSRDRPGARLTALRGLAEPHRRSAEHSSVPVPKPERPHELNRRCCMVTAADDFDDGSTRNATIAWAHDPRIAAELGITAFRSLWILGIRSGVRVRLVSACGRRLAAVLRRTLVFLWLVRLDVDRRRPMDLADPSLRAMGILDEPLVLDS